MMAAAGEVTVAEVEEIVPVGALDPDQIHTPGVYVQRIVACPGVEKRIERRTVRSWRGEHAMALTREELAQRAALEIETGST
jgi:hypothetical protein